MSKTLMQGNHKLSSPVECAQAIDDAAAGDPVTMERLGKLLVFRDGAGRLLGTLTSRHSVAKALDAGNSLVHCAVSWRYGPSEDQPSGLISIRIATGDPDDEYVKWCQRESWGKPRPARVVKSYATNIVGESQFQDTIGRCREGDTVTLFREPTNPHDANAIVVKTAGGETIGYIARTHWLHRVVHEEGSGAVATIQSLFAGAHTAVVLDVTVSGNPLEEAAYSPR